MVLVKGLLLRPGMAEVLDAFIATENAVVFAKAVHTMQRMGDDLYIEADYTKMVLRTVNSARSAYACFELARDFFTSYRVKESSTADVSGSSPHSSDTSVHAKVLAVFRSLHQIEKQVSKCRVMLNFVDAFLEVQLHCRHGVVKTHRLNIEEADSIQAVYDAEAPASTIEVPPKLFSETLVHFHSSIDEITISPQRDELEIANWVDGMTADGSSDSAASNVLERSNCTRVKLHKNEFKTFSIDQQTRLTFCLKELRSICSFSDFVSAPLKMVFDTAGSPIIFQISLDHVRADCVMSTVNLSDEDMANPALLGTSASMPSSAVSATMSSPLNQSPHSFATAEPQFEGRCAQPTDFTDENSPGSPLVLDNDLYVPCASPSTCSPKRRAVASSDSGIRDVHVAESPYAIDLTSRVPSIAVSNSLKQVDESTDDDEEMVPATPPPAEANEACFKPFFRKNVEDSIEY